MHIIIQGVTISCFLFYWMAKIQNNRGKKAFFLSVETLVVLIIIVGVMLIAAISVSKLIAIYKTSGIIREYQTFAEAAAKFKQMYNAWPGDLDPSKMSGEIRYQSIINAATKSITAVSESDGSIATNASINQYYMKGNNFQIGSVNTVYSDYQNYIDSGQSSPYYIVQGDIFKLSPALLPHMNFASSNVSYYGNGIVAGFKSQLVVPTLIAAKLLPLNVNNNINVNDTTSLSGMSFGLPCSKTMAQNYAYVSSVMQGLHYFFGVDMCDKMGACMAPAEGIIYSHEFNTKCVNNDCSVTAPNKAYSSKWSGTPRIMLGNMGVCGTASPAVSPNVPPSLAHAIDMKLDDGIPLNPSGTVIADSLTFSNSTASGTKYATLDNMTGLPSNENGFMFRSMNNYLTNAPTERVYGCYYFNNPTGSGGSNYKASSAYNVTVENVNKYSKYINSNSGATLESNKSCMLTIMMPYRDSM